MKLSQLAAKPQLIKLSIDDEATIKEHGESIDFWTWDRQPLDTFMKLANSDQANAGAMIDVVRTLILDENGKEFNSLQLSKEINKWMNQSISNVIFIIGGPYGFDQSVYNRANLKISLSKLTFSHQMVRLFFVEQIYRSFTILKGEPYHHQ